MPNKKGKGTYSKISSTKSKPKKTTKTTQVVKKYKSKSLSKLQQELEDAFGRDIERISVDKSVNGMILRFKYPNIIYDYDFRQRFKQILDRFDIDHKRTALKHNPILDYSMALVYIYSPNR